MTMCNLTVIFSKDETRQGGISNERSHSKIKRK